MSFGGNIPKTKLHTLQRFQDRALSIIKNVKIKDKWQGNWLKVENLIKLDQAVMMLKINNKLCPKVYGANSGTVGIVGIEGIVGI